MNVATPFVLCIQNEDFRSLLRDMLTKHGFFHVLETSTSSEFLETFSQQTGKQFSILESELVDGKIVPLLLSKNHFIILARSADEALLPLIARLGVKHFMSFPFSSQNLIDKIVTIQVPKVRVKSVVPSPLKQPGQ